MTNAARYSRDHGGRALVIRQGGQEILAEGQNGFPLTRSKDIQSCSKATVPVILHALMADGWLSSLDVLVSVFIPTWNVPPYSTATLRQVITMLSGLDAASGHHPTYEESLATAMPPADVGRYKYGTEPVFVVCAVINVIVQAYGFADVADYLNHRILTPAGVAVGNIEYVAPNQPNLAGGISMTARNLAAFGEYVLNNPTLLSALMVPSPYAAYSNEGGWWLMMADSVEQLIGGNLAGAVQFDGVAAAGAGNQRLLLRPAIKNADGVVVRPRLVCVRYGVNDPTWNDKKFVGLLPQ